MDIVGFWAKQVEKWNNEKRCGFCWQYGAPLVHSEMSNQQFEAKEDCCVRVFVVDPSGSEGRTRNYRTGFITDEWCDENFTLYALMPVPMGVNNYNETLGYPIEESKWNSVYLPLKDCLGCDNLLDFCEIEGYEIEIVSKRWALVHNYLSEYYNGWRFTFQFRIRK